MLSCFFLFIIFFFKSRIFYISTIDPTKLTEFERRCVKKVATEARRAENLELLFPSSENYPCLRYLQSAARARDPARRRRTADSRRSGPGPRRRPRSAMHD